MSQKIKRVKVGWTIANDLVDILLHDYKKNGRSPGWHLDNALRKHIADIGLIPSSADVINNGICTCPDETEAAKKGRDFLGMHEPGCPRLLPQ